MLVDPICLSVNCLNQKRCRLVHCVAKLEIPSQSAHNFFRCFFDKQDNDHLKSQQDWLSEVHKLRADLATARKDVNNKDREKEEITNEKSLLEVALQEKELEIDRLQDLARWV